MAKKRSFTIWEWVDAAPDAVYRVVTDIDRFARWMPNTASVRKLSSGDFGPGTTWRTIRDAAGGHLSGRFSVLRCEPNRCIELMVDESDELGTAGSCRYRYVLRPEESGTRVMLEGTIEGQCRVLGAFGGLFMKPMQRACLRELEALRDFVERESRPISVTLRT